jgi:hypothetical protein
MAVSRYAARGVMIIWDSSRSDASRLMSEWIRRSREIEGSPVSIFATRNWLDWIFAEGNQGWAPVRPCLTIY